ncbi:UTP--glucose-1-phosphate uridylyltransferase [Candidatus Babeliales bacterium]|nr:UTP--glucose-1-phosphate uridylyltransferase [Candidatus Babeliales bacterium]
MIIKKILIPAAGFGTRFAPFTQAVPKELLPLLNVPVIDYVLKEAFDAGLKDVVSIVSGAKKSFEDHVEALVAAKQNGNAFFVRQREQKGLGHAVWCARGCYFDELVPVMLPDNIFVGGHTPFEAMIPFAQKHGVSIIAVQEVAADQVEKYGIADVGKMVDGNIFQLNRVVEKPRRDKSPSNLAIVGRYILHSDIFVCLEKTSQGFGGEYQLTDAIQLLIDSGRPVYAYKIQSKFCDVGTPSGWLETVLAIASTDANLRIIIKESIFASSVSRSRDSVKELAQ